MEWQDVRGRIEAGEDRHTEFKRGLGDLSAVAEERAVLDATPAHIDLDASARSSSEPSVSLRL